MVLAGVREGRLQEYAALFDGEPPASVQALGRRIRPSLVDLFIALTRAPEAERTQF